MNTRTLLILLSLSLLFNACFIAGWIGASNLAAAGAGAGIDRLAQSLELDDVQRKHLDELHASMRSETAAIQAHVGTLRRQLAQALESDSPDLEHVRTLVADISAEQREAQMIAADHLGSFLDMLDPKQRRTLGRRLGRGGHHHMPPPHVLEPYDADDNGQLDDDELASAMSDIRSRHERIRERQAELAREFDADGDGRLNGEEREALRAKLLEEGLLPPHHGDRAGRGERGSGEGRRGPRRGRGQGRGGEAPPSGDGPPAQPPPTF
ncbi:MAG: periplasmic heavy metal sensor [Phycisphaerales bacterium]|nr:periplasmic heavy metal sensor [Phycisphaerales bacterium]